MSDEKPVDRVREAREYVQAFRLAQAYRGYPAIQAEIMNSVKVTPADPADKTWLGSAVKRGRELLERDRLEGPPPLPKQRHPH